MTLTLAQVLEKVDEIRRQVIAGDYERAHLLEDALYVEVLSAIAKGDCRDPAACAECAVVTNTFDFPRYCA